MARVMNHDFASRRFDGNGIPKGLVALAAAGVIALSSDFIESQSLEEFRNCEVYQGYTIDHTEGTVKYVFDHQELSERGNKKPNYALGGHSRFIDQLEIGERYCFDAKKSTFSSFDGELVSAKLDNSYSK